MEEERVGRTRHWTACSLKNRKLHGYRFAPHGSHRRGGWIDKELGCVVLKEEEIRWTKTGTAWFLKKSRLNGQRTGLHGS